MWSRFFPSYQRLRELLLADSIGHVINIEVKHGFNASQEERVIAKSLGGSITLELGAYALQLAQFIYGCPPSSLHAEGLLNDDGVDIEVRFRVEYGEGRAMNAYISGCENLENYARIIGTKGEIKVFLLCFK